MGWISPIGKDGEMLTHVVGDYIMICAQRQDRILPASVVRDATDEKVAELEDRQGRKIYRKESSKYRKRYLPPCYLALSPAISRCSLIWDRKKISW